MAYGVIDGQGVTAAITNPAFIVKNDDDITTHKVGLQSTDVADGPILYTSAQRALNTLDTTTGATETVPATTYGAAAGTISDGQNHLQSLIVLANKFGTVAGHRHRASTAGDGQPIVASDLTSVPLKGYIEQGADILAVTGISSDISTQFASKTASAGSSSVGVVVSPPFNKALLRHATGTNAGDVFVDGSGNEVYGRITEALAVWTLTFYVDLAGVETSYNFTVSSDVRFYYQELFNPMVNPPVYSEFAVIPSDNVTADAVDATTTQRGLVSTGSQSFGGEKTLVNGLIVQTSSAIPKTDDTLTASGTVAYVPFKKILGAAGFNIQGISGGADGKTIVIYNASAFDQTIKNEDAGATASNRFTLPGALDIPLKANSSIEFIYDFGATRWVIKSASGGGSPGGIDKQIQFNDGGAFGGDAGLTYDKTLKSLSQGDSCVASGTNSHAEGKSTRATGFYAHSEGQSDSPGTNGIASGQAAHSEGRNGIASGSYSHSEGYLGTASGTAAHAEGGTTISSGLGSHSEGLFTLASHDGGHAAGLGTKTGRASQTVVGEYNTGGADTFFEVGKGTGVGTESDAFAVSTGGAARINFAVLKPDSTQTIGATFTIAVSKTYSPLTCTADRTSSAVTAIAAGLEAGQLLILDNRGGFNITIKSGAGVNTPGAIDYTINPNSTMTLIWTGSAWTTTATSSN